MLPPQEFDADRKRILVIDGYGFRALGALYLIDKLVQSASKRAKKPLLPCDLFDLICGTSSGALVAILLGRLGLDCNKAIMEYKHLAKACCGDDENRFWDETLAGRQANTSSYVAALSALMAKYSPNEQDPEMLISKESTTKTTNTSVVVTSADPDFSNRARCIRSYPGPKSSPPGHRWTVFEAARAASATPFYLSPLLIDNEYGFRDSAFSGFNNPINLVKNEHRIIWPNEPNVLIISIGTDTDALVPDSVRKDWEARPVTESQSASFVDAIVAKLTGINVSVTDSHRRTARYIAQGILSAATETRAAHLQNEDKDVPRQLYYRIDPPLGLEKMALVDCFQEDTVKKSFDSWANSAKEEKNISDISSLLVDKISEVQAEDLRKMDPPAPPEGTVNPGYHPQLDKRRPEDMMDYLRNYSVLFIIDDSNSMKGKLWDETREALTGIAEYAMRYNAHEISIAFFNSKRVFSGADIQGEDAIRKIFTDDIRGTPTEATLSRHLNEQLRKLNDSVGLAEYAKVRPLDIIVLTDGKPDDEPKNPILTATKEIKEKKHHPNSIGIQFVQIGNDPKAKNALKELAYTEEVGMVDTVPYESHAGGKLTPEVLERIVLGGLHPNLRTFLREK